MTHFVSRKPSSAPARMAGQSLTEALVGMAALGGLFVLIPVLGRYQDLALQTLHAASNVAFATARDAPSATRSAAYPFQDAARRWTDRRGKSMLTLDETGIGAVVDVADDAAAPWQLGAQQVSARQLRQDWGLDRGIVTARVRISPVLGTGASPAGAAQSDDASAAGTRWTGLVVPPIHRRVAILAGAGHADGDAAAQSRMASSALAWSSNATRSVGAGRAAAAVLQPLDAAWNRPAPDVDWLSAWSGLVPAAAVGER